MQIYTYTFSILKHYNLHIKCLRVLEGSVTLNMQ